MKKVRDFLGREPWVIAVVVSALIFGAYSAIEHARALAYTEQVSVYRESSTTKAALAMIDSVENGREAQLCELTVNSVMREDYTHATIGLLSQLNDTVQKLDEPRFYSAGVHIPSVIEARALHGELSRARQSLRDLSVAPSLLNYCTEVADALSDMWFLRELSSSEGVNALQPNQLENYIVRFNQAYSKFKEINKVPVQVGSVHKSLNDSLVSASQSLQSVFDSPEEYSSNMKRKLEVIDKSLAGLSLETGSVQELPELLQKAGIPLRPQ